MLLRSAGVTLLLHYYEHLRLLTAPTSFRLTYRLLLPAVTWQTVRPPTFICIPFVNMSPVLTPAVPHGALYHFFPCSGRFHTNQRVSSTALLNEACLFAFAATCLPVSKSFGYSCCQQYPSFSLTAEWQISRTGFSPAGISNASWRT